PCLWRREPLRLLFGLLVPTAAPAREPPRLPSPVLRVSWSCLFLSCLCRWWWADRFQRACLEGRLSSHSEWICGFILRLSLPADRFTSVTEMPLFRSQKPN